MCPFPPVDIIWAVMIVWRIRGRKLSELFCAVYDSCAQWYAHTYEQLLKMSVGLGLVFVCLFRFSIFCLWSPYGIGQTSIFLPWFPSSIFFPHLISAVWYRMPTILHTWCGLSANLECMSEMCCTQLAESTGCKNDAKKSPSGHHRTT